MRKINTLLFVLLAGFSVSYAQNGCSSDMNGYVDSKNVGGTDWFPLQFGQAKMVSQAYHFSGPGVLNSVRVEYNIPAYGVRPMRVALYNIDANNRPTGQPIAQVYRNFHWSNSSIEVDFGGVQMNNDFAIVVERMNLGAINIRHTGNGEGNMEDLSSQKTLFGNWTTLGTDGDLYIMPRMFNENMAEFTVSNKCIGLGGMVDFTNTSEFVQDKMFNQITDPGYTGSETLYSWDFGGLGTSTMENPSFTFNTPGVHTVTLTTTIDDWEGAVCQNTYSFDVSVGLEVVATATDLTCNGDDSGQIAFSANYGTPPYAFSIDGMFYDNSPLTDLPAGSYDIYVKDSYGCVANGLTVVVSEPDAIVVSTPVSTTLATCGNADGGLYAQASGGTGSLLYSLDNTSYQPSGSFTGLAGGSYTLYVKDFNNSCVDSSTIVVVGNTSSPSLTLQSYTNLACKGDSDGTITVIGSGGSGTLQYSIDGQNYQSSGTFNNLIAGTYSVTVMDAAGCIGYISPVTLTEPKGIRWTVSSVSTLCNGTSDGEIEVGPVTGGTGTMSFSLDGVNFQNETNFAGLSAGIYQVTVQDGAGCLATSMVTVQEPNPIAVSVASASDLSCFESQDGALTVNVTGGNGGYMYQLNNWHPQSSSEFMYLAAGTYDITVMDKNSCTGSTTYTIAQPTQITANITTGNSTCTNANGTILVVAAGGSGSGYSYDLNQGSVVNGTGAFAGLMADEYGIIVTDGTGCQTDFTAVVSDSDGPSIGNTGSQDVTCNGGNDGQITVNNVTGGTGGLQYSIDGAGWQASNVFTGLTAGSHYVVVKDANGCNDVVTVVINEPNPINVVLTGSDNSCYGGSNGSIDVAAGGGAGTLVYSIDGINFQSSTLFNNLAAGTYEITIKDNGQCTTTEEITILQPTEIIMNTGSLNVECYGGASGAIGVSAFGGTTPLMYSIDGTTFQSGSFFTGLTAGTYIVYAQDANGCVKAKPVTITQPAELIVSSFVSDVACSGGNDGYIDVTVNGGTAPYYFTWYGTHFSTTEDIFNLEPGNYSLVVTDANGCSFTDNFIVEEPTNPIVANGTVSDATSSSANDGMIDLTVTGGTSPYTYNWSNGATTEDISGLAPGIYTVEVTDVNGCITTTTFNVQVGLGINEANIAEGVKVYPNPASKTLYIVSSSLTDRVEMVDMTGKKVFVSTPGTYKSDIDVSKYSEGVYFINIYNKDGLVTKRVVVK